MVGLKTRLMVLGGAIAVAGLVAAAFLARANPQSAATTAASAPVVASTPHLAYPRPPAGAVVYARQWGGSALALGVVPGSGSTLVQASVLGPQGKGVSGLQISLNGHRGAPCGRGCYRVRLGSAPRTVALRVRSTTWRVPLPTPWPPKDGTAIVRRATSTWRALGSLTVNEYLASDAVHSTTSVWRIQAPDRVAYQVADGWGGIVVGDKRWDRAPRAKRWVESPQTPITQPTPAWVHITDAHVLGTSAVAGRPVWLVSFFDPVTPAWFKVAVDRSTYRTLESHMITTAHFMDDRYSAFNRTRPISPPS
jgi:hypothetical protein